MNHSYISRNRWSNKSILDTRHTAAHLISMTVYTGVFCKCCDKTPLTPPISCCQYLYFSVFFILWFCNIIDMFLQDEENEDFLSICRAMEEIVDDPVDCYWLIKCFVNQFHTKFGDSIPHLVSVTMRYNEKNFVCHQNIVQSNLNFKVYFFILP